MDKLINFAVNLMERENHYEPALMPFQNPGLSPSQNREINTSQNQEINSTQNPEINWTQTPNWKQNQWELFKQMILRERMNQSQRLKCKKFLESL